LAALDSFGQAANVKELAVGHHASIPDHALKLSDVSRPWIGGHSALCSPGQARDGFLIFLRKGKYL